MQSTRRAIDLRKVTMHLAVVVAEGVPEGVAEGVPEGVPEGVVVPEGVYLPRRVLQEEERKQQEEEEEEVRRRRSRRRQQETWRFWRHTRASRPWRITCWLSSTRITWSLVSGTSFATRNARSSWKLSGISIWRTASSTAGAWRAGRVQQCATVCNRVHASIGSCLRIMCVPDRRYFGSVVFTFVCMGVCMGVCAAGTVY